MQNPWGAGGLRTPNLNLAIVKQIEENLGLTFVNEKQNIENIAIPKA